jgi:hypothetical protein
MHVQAPRAAEVGCPIHDAVRSLGRFPTRHTVRVCARRLPLQAQVMDRPARPHWLRMSAARTTVSGSGWYSELRSLSSIKRLSARRKELSNYRERSPPSNRRPAEAIRRRAEHSGSMLSRSLNPRNVRVAQGQSTRAQPQGDRFHRYRTCRLSGRLAWQTVHVHNQRPGCIPDRSRTNTRHFRSISHSPAASRREMSGYFGRTTRRVARR